MNMIHNSRSDVWFQGSDQLCWPCHANLINCGRHTNTSWFHFYLNNSHLFFKTWIGLPSNQETFDTQSTSDITSWQIHIIAVFNNQLFQLSYPVFWEQRHPNNNSTNSGKEDDKNNNNIKHRHQRQQQLQLHLLHQAPRHSSAPVLPRHDPSPSVPHFPQVPQLLSSSQVITSPLHSPPLSKVSPPPH